MKKILSALLLTGLICITTYAQDLPTQNSPVKRTEEYCDVTIIDRMGHKVAISIDYGQDPKIARESVKDDKGKPMLFNSPIEVLHYMNAQGWELVERYMDPTQRVDNRHYLLKRKVER
ncbi:hypothetical protein [Sabulibacter ruber]|uniref:hypothetical protein n=1 Tax=Sabulibacter ruber TaxID=2811901 RepID=UPI001A96D341|nr:hypothetical protein [Sabulibacter ruber]